MVDHVPLAGPSPELALLAPRIPPLALLVGRLTTIKLAYWIVLTSFELAIAPHLGLGFGASVGFAALTAVTALTWARWAARVPDRRAGQLVRSLPAALTAFIVTSVVATPAGLPLLLVERERSIQGCGALGTCHMEAIVFWVAAFAVGALLIPLAFVFSLRDTS